MALTIASVPAAAGLAWHRHRQTVRTVTEHPARAPVLPGKKTVVSTPWGTAAYRWVEGDRSKPTLVLIHGWGKTGDTAWWPIMTHCSPSMVVVDLPGHGHSRLEKPFTFELAAESLLRVIADAELDRPLLVAHSMGGPVALWAIRVSGLEAFSGLVALATSAYWVSPRIRAMMAMAPYVMGPRSPILLHTERSDLTRDPERAPHISWAYTRRPLLPMLRQGAAALRRFDAQRWTSLSLPPTRWVVATKDRVLPPAHQYASARLFDAEVSELPVRHSMILDAPDEVANLMNETADIHRSFPSSVHLS